MNNLDNSISSSSSVIKLQPLDSSAKKDLQRQATDWEIENDIQQYNLMFKSFQQAQQELLLDKLKYQMALTNSTKDICERLPENILNLNAQDFLQRCEEQEFEERFNLQYKVVDNSCFKILLPISQLLQASYSNRVVEQAREEEEELYFSASEGDIGPVLVNQEVQCIFNKQPEVFNKDSQTVIEPHKSMKNQEVQLSHQEESKEGSIQQIIQSPGSMNQIQSQVVDINVQPTQDLFSNVIGQMEGLDLQNKENIPVDIGQQMDIQSENLSIQERDIVAVKKESDKRRSIEFTPTIMTRSQYKKSLSPQINSDLIPQQLNLEQIQINEREVKENSNSQEDKLRQGSNERDFDIELFDAELEGDNKKGKKKGKKTKKRRRF